MPVHSVQFRGPGLGPGADVGEDARLAPRIVLLYFITGNPGLVDYYAPFLQHLRRLLDESPVFLPAACCRRAAAPRRALRFHIYGQDLLGFTDHDGHAPFSSPSGPYSLEDQVRHSLSGLCHQRIPASACPARSGQPYDQVVLIGHSVGAYIALEICRRLHESGAPSAHLGASDSGKSLARTSPWLGGALGASRLAAALLWPFPLPAVRWLAARLLGHPPTAADTTARWLKSRDGVWQAVRMALDELRVIRAADPRWAGGPEVWAPAAAAAALEKGQSGGRQDEGGGGTRRAVAAASMPELGDPPRLYFFYGKRDHWVADEQRDAFVARRKAAAAAGRQQARGRRKPLTTLVVDEGDIPHAFSIHNSETVAETVNTWIRDLFE